MKLQGDVIGPDEWPEFRRRLLTRIEAHGGISDQAVLDLMATVQVLLWPDGDPRSTVYDFPVKEEA